MNFETVNYDKINETMHLYEHKSGLKAFVIPKKGYSKKYAAFSAHYGSINNEFIVPGENEPTRVPDGIAHFLEHKLFEQKDGSVMDKFSALGSNPNAYTGFSQTVYLFSCTDRFNENFNLLLDFVQNPYITEESVEKEKGIIGQEISMYDDDPNWRSFFNLLRSLYVKNPVRIDIAGTAESIANINRENLYRCYNTFYHPSNMVVVAVGDLDADEVLEMIEKGIGASDKRPEIKRILPQEGNNINADYAEQKLAVSTPIFQMGFRDDTPDVKGLDSLMHEVAVKILLEMIMGRSSELYNRLYGEGLINHTFDFDFTCEENFAFSAFGGESPDPYKVRDRLRETLDEINTRGLDENNYKRVRKALYGRFLRQLNSVEKISHAFISVYFKGVNIFDYPDVYDKISFEYVSEVFKEHFDEGKLALSVIKPY